MWSLGTGVQTCARPFPLVAPALRGEPARKPAKLLRQFGVEPLRVSRRFLLDLFRPCLETAETHLRPPDAAALQPQGRTRQPGQEGAVMADRDECAVVA